MTKVKADMLFSLEHEYQSLHVSLSDKCSKYHLNSNQTILATAFSNYYSGRRVSTDPRKLPKAAQHWRAALSRMITATFSLSSILLFSDLIHWRYCRDVVSLCASCLCGAGEIPCDITSSRGQPVDEEERYYGRCEQSC